MVVRIRRLRDADHPRFAEILAASGMRPRLRGRDGLKAFRTQLASAQNVYLGAFDGDRLVGVVLGTHDTRKGWINRLAVDPAHRRRGIATRLVRACERGLRAQGIEIFAALIEDGNEGSEAFFCRLGYRVMRMTYARRKIREDV